MRSQTAAQFAGIAHLAERHLAKVEVASANLVARSNSRQIKRSAAFFIFSETLKEVP